MIGLRFELSIPKYVMSKIYHSASRGKLPPVFPNLHLKQTLPEVILNGPKWVKLKSLLSGICGSDQNMLRGHESFSMEPYASFPCCLGHENVSEVVEVGRDVAAFKVGDIVVVNPAMGCKVHDRQPLCHYCQNDLDALCENFGSPHGLGAGMSLGYHKATGGGWSQYFQAHEWQLHRVPSGVPLERAVLADPFSTSMQAVAHHAGGQSQPKTVLILGAGTIGLLAAAAIRTLKLPWRVILGYRYAFQGDLGKELGADHIIKTGRGFYDEHAKLVGGTVRKVSLGKPVFEGGVDTVFDCVGSPQTIDDSLRLTKIRGAVVMVATASQMNGVDPAPLWFREITLTGSCMSRSVVDPRDGKTKQVYDLICDALPGLKIEKLLTHKFPIQDYKKALRTAMIKSREPVIKVAFSFVS